MPLLTKNHFLLMFDPHRTRYNDRRYFTKKGQIIQAKKVDPPFSIENEKIDAYKKYLEKNHLISSTPTIDSFKFTDDPVIYKISDMNVVDHDQTISGRRQVITISTSTANSNYWAITIVYLNNAASYYTIPANVRYKIFDGVFPVDDFFTFYAQGRIIMEIAQRYEDDPSASKTYFAVHTFSKSLFNIKGIPA